MIYQIVYYIDNQLNFKILHALGLLHEHQRPDRDEHIDVDMISIEKFGLARHFKKACFLQVQNLNYKLVLPEFVCIMK